jgi:hypothetical protein
MKKCKLKINYKKRLEIFCKIGKKNIHKLFRVIKIEIDKNKNYYKRQNYQDNNSNKIIK